MSHVHKTAMWPTEIPALKLAEVVGGPAAVVEVFEDGQLATIGVYATADDLPEQAEPNTRYFRAKDGPFYIGITRTSWR